MPRPRSLNPNIEINGGSTRPRARACSAEQLNAIAAAVRVRPEKVLDAAAVRFRLDDRRPTRIPAKRLENRIDQIHRTARRLLGHLGVEDLQYADDGPDFELAEIIAAETDDQAKAEDTLTKATARIGQLVQIFQAVKAVAEVATLSQNARVRGLRVATLTTTQGHVGDVATNSWIAEMLEVYTKITGRRPATSTNPHKDGEPSGPLIRFLTAAGKPLGIEMKPEAWRKRIRRIRDTSG